MSCIRFLLLGGILAFAVTASPAGANTDGPGVESYAVDASSGPVESVAASNKPKRLIRRGSQEKEVSGSDRRGSQLSKPDGLFDLFWPLGIVLGVVALCVLGFRKWMPRTNRWGGSQAIKVMSRHYLSNKQSLCLLRLGRRLVLVGVTPDRISTLGEINDPEEVATLVSAVERGRPGSFTSLFSQSTDRDLAGAEKDEGGDDMIEDERLVSSQGLARTGNRVHELVERVRTLSSGIGASAEST
ncbi:MAG: flagellar biosynthetic protein FliO [Phycisphaerales bacterium]|nr:flagellar biosynthetic protein FliO [Phycisphaerales bacterium]